MRHTIALSVRFGRRGVRRVASYKFLFEAHLAQLWVPDHKAKAVVIPVVKVVSLDGKTAGGTYGRLPYWIQAGSTLVVELRRRDRRFTLPIHFTLVIETLDPR